MKKIISVLSVFLIGLLVLSGCESDKETSSNVDENGIKTFTAFMAVPGKELPDDNRMMNKIAEKIGAKADVTWLTGQTASERIGVMIAGGEYPDFIDGSDGTAALINAGALIPLEDYLDDYPNIKNLYTDAQWNQIRNEDGHIYIIPQFGIVKGENMAVQHNDEAFWIQKRILEWADYPEITTLDEYFDLIESYLKENPTLDDGQKNIGFSILSDDWRYFCLENPPQFLAGYPNDGAAVIDPVTKEAKVYDKIPEAKEYYKILSEKFANGIIDPIESSFCGSFF
ncbi:extracellular solute-binding protein [Niallia circulans]|uniref:extracellular solute-binding protein n=1 Tax=Niallia circulans TaxID=1397 RepID=UPI001F459137|nr:extracellular solute-binding protein [Niallia circulans]MCF2649930.1 extracellular solute-binding protein [Niallia circulans]